MEVDCYFGQVLIRVSVEYNAFFHFTDPPSSHGSRVLAVSLR